LRKNSPRIPDSRRLRPAKPGAAGDSRGVRNPRGAGAAVERRARRYYRLRGYRVLDANVWSGGYELDLVLRRGSWVVFCEVKSKSGARFGDPLEMVTPEKERRLRRAAEAWLAQNREHGRCSIRFDVVAERAGKLERVAAAF
jgi:putative endonuclease